MKQSPTWCLVAFAAAFLAGGRSGGAEPWRVSEQPGLKDALERAPLLRTESLGEPARGVNVWERWMVPNPDGKTWDVLQVYFKEYAGRRGSTPSTSAPARCGSSDFPTVTSFTCRAIPPGTSATSLAS